MTSKTSPAFLFVLSQRCDKEDRPLFAFHEGFSQILSVLRSGMSGSLPSSANFRTRALLNATAQLRPQLTSSFFSCPCAPYYYFLLKERKVHRGPARNDPSTIVVDDRTRDCGLCLAIGILKTSATLLGSLHPSYSQRRGTPVMAICNHIVAVLRER